MDQQSPEKKKLALGEVRTTAKGRKIIGVERKRKDGTTFITSCFMKKEAVEPVQVEPAHEQTQTKEHTAPPVETQSESVEPVKAVKPRRYRLKKTSSTTQL